MLCSCSFCPIVLSPVQGELNGRRGLVPSNYIELVKSDDVVVMEDGSLGIHQEGMTREVGIDVDFEQPKIEVSAYTARS